MRCAFDVGASWSVSRLQNLNQIGSLGGKLQRDKDLLSFRETKIYSVCLFTLLFFLHAFVRSSRPDVLCKKGVLRNFGKFIEKHMCQKLFFNKVAGVRPATLLKKSLCHRCFSVNFAKFLQSTSGGCFCFLKSRKNFLVKHQEAATRGVLWKKLFLEIS